MDSNIAYKVSKIKLVDFRISKHPDRPKLVDSEINGKN